MDSISKNAINEFEQKIVKWHGAPNGLDGSPVINRSKHKTDFGQGFYCNSLRSMANDYALKGDVPELYEVTFPNLSKYSVYRFDDMEKWILFILHNRKYIVTGGNIKLEKLFDSINNNDLIIGPIADDNVETQLPKFAENKLPFEVIMQQLLVANLGSQWVIKSQGLLSYCNIKQIDLITRTRFTREGLQQEIKQIEMNYEGRTTYIRDIVERYV